MTSGMESKAGCAGAWWAWPLAPFAWPLTVPLVVPLVVPLAAGTSWRGAGILALGGRGTIRAAESCLKRRRRSSAEDRRSRNAVACGLAMLRKAVRPVPSVSHVALCKPMPERRRRRVGMFCSAALDRWVWLGRGDGVVCLQVPMAGEGGGHGEYSYCAEPREVCHERVPACAAVGSWPLQEGSAEEVYRSPGASAASRRRADPKASPEARCCPPASRAWSLRFADRTQA